MVVPPKMRWAALSLMILALGFSLGLPAEDVLDATFDECEPLPLEAAHEASLVLLQMSALIANAETRQSHVLTGALPTQCSKAPPQRQGERRALSDSPVVFTPLLRC